MNKTETGKILTVIGEVERREITPTLVEVWHRVIGHLPYEVADRALLRCLRTQRYAIKPADLLAHVPQARADIDAIRWRETHRDALERAVRGIEA